MFTSAGRGLCIDFACLVAAAFFSMNSPAQARGLSPTSVALPHVAKTLASAKLLRIVAFGSSSTEGVGASSPAASYPNRLQIDLSAALPGAPLIVLNRGRGGEDAADMMRRLPDIIAQHPDLVIWQTGTNDALHGMPLERFVALTRAGILAMRGAGIDVMLIEPQRCRAMQAKPDALLYRDAVRAIGAELHVPVIHRYDLMQTWLSSGLVTPVQLMSGDGLHMADGGYALLAKAVAHEILLDADAPCAVAGAD